jgi:beta-mannosidase
MHRQILSGPWWFRSADGTEWLPARVPGSVHLDLLALGRIPDPFLGDGLRHAAWVAEKDWEYRCAFQSDFALAAAERVELVCGGLDTVAEVFLNGERLGEARNMFRSYRWAVKPLLRPGVNVLLIRLRSPLAFVRAQHRRRPLPGLGHPGVAHLRKAPSHFGWDWGPELPPMGIWRPVALEGFSIARIADLHIRQHHHGERVTLALQARVERWRDLPLSMRITLMAPEGNVTRWELPVEEEAFTAELPVLRPHRWWPNGLGEQPLYVVETELRSGDRLLDRRREVLGLRTLALQREKDAWGESFVFVVNGVPLFAKGANVVPLDARSPFVPEEDLDRLVRSAAAAGMNVLRVWGGGGYGDDRFYALCDRCGILVWQDFPFACMLYPLDEPEFLEEVRAEVSENVRRLRHHPSLALWCGNNEIEMLWPLWRWQGWRRGAELACLAAAHERFFYHTLPEWVRAEDPDRPYWPGSPSSGAFRREVNGDRRGDAHLWRVWHGLAPTAAYRARIPRFVSEFGLQSLPTSGTLAAFGLSPHPTLRAPALRRRQRDPGGMQRLLYYLTERFPIPEDLEDLAWLTQIAQAEAVRQAVEYWRRHRNRCGGALYWQLNDTWPAISWSSLDVYGRWKALHYAARRFFAPIALSLDAQEDHVEIFLLNDTPHPWRGTIRWSLETFEGQVLERGEEVAEAPPLQGTLIRVVEVGAWRRRHRRALAFVAERWEEGTRQDLRVALFAPEKDLRLPDPGLMVEVEAQGETMRITLRARALARFVTLMLPGADIVFSDNFFDLPPGRTVTVHAPLPPGWTPGAVRRALRVRTLADLPRSRGWRARWLRLRGRLVPRALLSRLLHLG